MQKSRFLLGIIALAHVASASFAAPAAAADTSFEPPSSEAVADARQRAAQGLASSLQETVRAHGADAVVLQASLLMAALSAGALGPTQVSVIGPTPVAGPEFLRIIVDTGIIFDSDTTNAAGRSDVVWRDVATPALARLVSTDLKPAGVDLVIGYAMQSYQLNHTDKPDLDRHLQHGEARFSIPADALKQLVAGRLPIEELRSHADQPVDN